MKGSGSGGPAASTSPLLFVPHRRPLLEGRLMGRYERFLADVELTDGRTVTAHCVNPGRMEGLVEVGARVWLWEAPPEAKRKLRFTWELSESGGRLVGANTVIPNALVKALLEARVLRGLSRWDEMVPERRYGHNSRIDFWLRQGRQEHYLEVKNCHLVYPDGRGYFPDSVSERATKHLEELAEVVTTGARASVLFTVQRADAQAVRPSDLHDPTFAAAVRRVAAAGVRFRAVVIEPGLDGYRVLKTIPVDLKEYALSRHRRWRADADATSGWKRRPKG